MNRELCIPIPVHPNDRELPISSLNLRLPSGAFAQINIPIQGEKTIDNAIATLLLWKPSIVTIPDFEI
jgi:hypothetical protein